MQGHATKLQELLHELCNTHLAWISAFFYAEQQSLKVCCIHTHCSS